MEHLWKGWESHTKTQRKFSTSAPHGDHPLCKDHFCSLCLEFRASNVKYCILGPTPYSIRSLTIFKILLSCSVLCCETLLGACTYHMENASRLGGPESSDRDAVVGVAIAEAAALDDEVVDGVVQGWRGLRGRAGRQAGTALPLQQPHPQVGDLQLRLGLRAVRVLRGVGRRQRSENHLAEKHSGDRAGKITWQRNTVGEAERRMSASPRVGRGVKRQLQHPLGVCTRLSWCSSLSIRSGSNKSTSKSVHTEWPPMIPYIPLHKKEWTLWVSSDILPLTQIRSECPGLVAWPSTGTSTLLGDVHVRNSSLTFPLPEWVYFLTNIAHISKYLVPISSRLLPSGKVIRCGN